MIDCEWTNGHCTGEQTEPLYKLKKGRKKEEREYNGKLTHYPLMHLPIPPVYFQSSSDPIVVVVKPNFEVHNMRPGRRITLVFFGAIKPNRGCLNFNLNTGLPLNVLLPFHFSRHPPSPTIPFLSFLTT